MHTVGRIYKASGDTCNFTCYNETPTLLEMQQIVGGWIELIPIRPIKRFNEPCTMVVNEEGVLHELPLNHAASLIAGRRIVGDVIIMPSRLIV